MADDPATAPRLLLQLSDLHFGRENPRAVIALQALTRRLQPEALVVTGDLTQRATRRQFDAAADFVARLDAGCRVVLPGNHDLPLWAWWERLCCPWRRYRRRFGPQREPVLDLPWLRLVVADSVRRTRHQRGALGRTQIDRVADALAGAGEQQLRVVALHHPVSADATGDTSQVVYGAARAVRCWAQAGADLVLGGHVHRAFVAPLHRGRGAPARALWAVQAGTAVSQRVRGGRPASVNGIRFDPRAGAVQVERWDFDSARSAFCHAGSERLRLARP